MSFSNLLEDTVLDFAFGKVLYLPPSELVLGLSRGDPLDSGLGLDEPNASTGYYRVPTILGLPPTTDWLYVADGMVANSHPIMFPTALEDWGVITHFVLFDGLQMTIRGELSPHQQVNTGQKPRFNPTRLEIYID